MQRKGKRFRDVWKSKFRIDLLGLIMKHAGLKMKVYSWFKELRVFRMKVCGPDAHSLIRPGPYIFSQGLIFQWSRVESRRSLSVKADDPKKDQSRRSWSKADDPWAKADDPSKSRRSFVKADDLWAKPDDPGRKRTISRLKADDLIWNCENMKPDDLEDESRRSP